MSAEHTAELSDFDFPPSQQPDSPTLHSLASLVDPLGQDADRRHTAKRAGKPLGPTPAMPRVCREFGGSLPVGLHMLLGGPGAGKTAFALQLAATSGCPAMYVSCEMSSLELLRRVTARVTGTFLGRLKSGELCREEAQGLAGRAAQDCRLLTLADATASYAHPDWILKAGGLCRGTHEHLLVVIDSLHSWVEAAEADLSEYEAISTACQSLRSLASRLNCPILAICERNRASFGRHAPKDRIGAGAGSRKIEYASESVLSLDVDESALAGCDLETPIVLTFAKNRHGTKGATVRLLFNGALQRFVEEGA